MREPLARQNTTMSYLVWFLLIKFMNTFCQVYRFKLDCGCFTYPTLHKESMIERLKSFVRDRSSGGERFSDKRRKKQNNTQGSEN